MGSRESAAQIDGDATKNQDHNGLHDLEDVEDISELNQGTEGQTAMGSWVLVDEMDEHLIVKTDRGIKKEEEKKSVTNSNGRAVDCCEDYFMVKVYEDFFSIGSVQKEENIEKDNENEVSVGEIIERFKTQEVEEKEKRKQLDKGVLYEMESASLFGNGGNDPFEECRRYYEERRFLESRVAQLKQEITLLDEKTSRRTVPKKSMEIGHQLKQDYIKFLMKCCRGSIEMIMELLKNYAPTEQIERQIRQLEKQVEDVRSTTDPELWGNMK